MFHDLRAAKIPEGARAVDFATSKPLALKSECSSSIAVIPDPQTSRALILSPSESVFLEGIQEALRNLRHLTVGHAGSRRPTEEAFGYFVRLVPNITSLSFTWSFPIVPSSLRFLTQPLVKLQIDFTIINESAFINLIVLSSSRLQELRLEHLWESEQLLTRRAFEKIADCKKLRLLSISAGENELRSSHLGRIFFNVTGLEFLKLRLPERITSLDHIECLRSLRFIILDRCASIDCDILCKLGDLSSLWHLELREWRCTIKVFRKLAHLKNLRSLILRADNLTPDCFAIISESFKQLERLRLSDIEKLTDDDAVKLRSLKKLKILHLGNAIGLTERTFEEGVGSAAMEALSVVGATSSDVTLTSIARHHPHLRSVLLTDCDRITDAGLISFLDSEPRLLSIKLGDCGELTDRSLDAISSRPLLRRLQLTGLRKINPAAESQFREKRPLVFVELTLKCYEGLLERFEVDRHWE